MTTSSSHLVLIPSYNSGRMLIKTVREALDFWRPVWVIIDGSTDGSDRALEQWATGRHGLRLLRLPDNRGKGGAVLAGLLAAQAEGLTRALVMDSDRQHPADCIPRFMEMSLKHPGAMILGVPRFPANAPFSRRKGRRIGNWWANLETFWGGINDSLFGFRVYPVAETICVMQQTRGARRFDFDTEVAVRLFWAGVQPINVPVPVRYYTPEEGGVSQFRYWRDNLLLIRRHTRLVLEMFPQLSHIWRLSRQGRQPGSA